MDILEKLKSEYDITKGLIIDGYWLKKILYQDKTWEMRTRNTKIRGNIALIKKGTGEIHGVANLVDSVGPQERNQLQGSYDMHKIPSGMYEQEPKYYRWNCAWVLKDVNPIVPIKYKHPQGAVIWVNL